MKRCCRGTAHRKCHGKRWPHLAVGGVNGSLTVETGKANGQEPYAWLRHALERLAQASSTEDHEVLLPVP